MLVLLVGSSYMLVSRLNEYAQAYARDAQTRIALLKAKKALLNYAMNYPEFKSTGTVRGPGYLPCPDENDDGAGEGNCSVTTGSTLGRLPTQTLGLGDLRDSSGERLWYAVSQNFKYNQPAGYVLNGEYVLNSETPGTISVDGTGDVVAVVIAPGEPVTGQTGRQPTPETAWLTSNHLDLYQVAGQYLEDDNATTGDASYVTSSSSGGEFDDQLVTITRAELMQYVQKRVLGEARAALAKYQNSAGAYPWLAPFGDPKADARWVRGYASAAGTGDLMDSSVDFTALGIETGDVVWNISQGTVGKVSGTPTSAGDVPASGMSFAANDEYLIEPSGLAAVLSDGTAGGGSSGTTLVDVGKDFDAPLAAPGDIIDDTTSGCSGRVDSVDDDTITVVKLSGCTNSYFSSGDKYRIRSNTGVATSGSSGTTLMDADANFQATPEAFGAMNVQAGALVRDLDDGSFGQVASVTGPHTLTVTSLNMGTNDKFTTGDHYVISRYDPVPNTTEGMLPIQEPGQAFATGFTLDWSASGATLVSGGTDSAYNTAITNLAKASASYNATVSVSSSNGECISVWSGVDATNNPESIADCRGINSDVLKGTAQSWSGGVLYDSNMQFAAQGIKRGDKITNLNTGTQGIITSAGSGQASVRSISGYTAFSASSGQSYRVYPATNVISGSLINFFGINCTTANLSGVSAGDVVVNTSQGNGVGLVTSVSNLFGFLYLFSYTNLSGGLSSIISVGDSFTIHSNFVQRRDIQFQVRMKGDETDLFSSGVRTRTV